MYEYLWYFVIYAFIGWCTEVVYAAFKHGKFINRGFLSGPVCPIYGFGVILVVMILSPINKNFLALYLGSVLLTSALELVTGFLMFKLFHSRWWDYSNNKFNIGGYVCLRFSLLWGVACVIAVDFFHPFFERLVSTVPRIVGLPIVFVLIGVTIADAVYTIIGVNKLNKKLRQMEELTLAMRKLSDSIGENVAENALAIKENTERIKQESEKALSEIQHKNEQRLQEMQKKAQEIFNKNCHIHKRLLKAFPNFKSEIHSEALFELREKLKKSKKQEKK